MENVLELKNVSKQFGSGHVAVTALHDVNFSITPGQFVTIIGPSGSGKSTFLTIAAGLQTPTSGQVLLNGHDLSAQSEKQRLRDRFAHVGFILQGSNLIPYLTVAEQFKLVDRLTHQKFQREEMRHLLDRLDLSKLENNYPNELSGGERQRVAIAKALFHDPDIVLADEPTASLDSARSFDVVKRLISEAHDLNKAIIMVTHDERLTKDSDAVYRIEDGQMTEF
ncbi:ABC transporter ATP-binding protein [Furfurilactobacillus siliginis]|uniref:Putative hemin import ATP-binding protein HrtA n=1 Tax=Furfurilactobacillus siliginis TaxID=348151 RepID=A0A0R2L5W6_9LACO|nr:ABC transporter ATP-binding protein [Furfurilactobacillus siliginis]KRN97192.1 abc transporter, atp-binding protein [Furfurilactobacillus siliginis]GEK28654.1 ABC transporter ATP-binding protein [Furfurilactobacillus siliginis]